MKKLKFVFYLLVVLVMLAAVVVFLAPWYNSYKQGGQLVLAGLHQPVKVVRDAKAMPYIFAQDMHDAIMAQGFVTAQDRLFQMELARMAAGGRFCELVGEKALSLDKRMRTIGLYRVAAKHAKVLDQANLDFLQAFADGVNAYMTTRPGELGLAFTLAGIKPKPWTIVDSLAVYYYLSWSISANLKNEIVAQMLVDKLGLEKASQIFPLNLNPDEIAGQPKTSSLPAGHARLNLAADARIMAFNQIPRLRWGSNAWAVPNSPSGKPVVANDPHLDPRMLPGALTPCGIITKDVRMVGITVAGVPGLVVGRNQYIAVGATNSYADVTDLYIETLDPADPIRYMEGERAIPFEIITETIKIKDGDAEGGYRTEKFAIRLSKRGPVVSGVLKGFKTNKVLTLRWAPAEGMGPSLGLMELMRARSVGDVRKAVDAVDTILFNLTYADVHGNVELYATGKVPRRSAGGALPYPVGGGQDNWQGWIPFDQMPHVANPRRGWVCSANHKTVKSDYPWYFSSYFAPNYRYDRVRQLLSTPGVKTVDDHWRFQRDKLNLLAKRVAPLMAKALAADPATKGLANILAAWDFVDDKDAAAPLIFQALMRSFALKVYADELGEDLARRMLANWYFWQQRMEHMILAGDSPWFDDTRTADVHEKASDLWVAAGKAVLAELGPALGNDVAAWRWGDVHRLTLVHPLRREGLGSGLLGGGSHEMGGSGETLYRAWYDFNKPYAINLSASLRMVADLGDPDKVLAVMPGGVTGRLFSPHMTDQIEDYMSGAKVYWWFSDQAITEHAASTQLLKPR